MPKAEPNRERNTRSYHLYLGVDGGGTNTDVALMNEAREVIAVQIVGAGARVHAGARVVALDAERSGWLAVTANGATVRAGTVLMATNAYADGLVPGLARSIVALNSLQIATAPIPPSRLAIRSSKAAVVGFIIREYVFPYSWRLK